MRAALLAAGLALCALPAAAQEVDCANAMTQADMNQCAQAEWEAADHALNSAYKAAMALLRQWDDELPTELKGGADNLRLAQRAWITFRDAACAVEGYPMRGGSAEPLLVLGCMTRLTEARTADLQALVEFGDY